MMVDTNDILKRFKAVRRHKGLPLTWADQIAKAASGSYCVTLPTLLLLLAIPQEDIPACLLSRERLNTFLIGTDMHNSGFTKHFEVWRHDVANPILTARLELGL